MQFPCPLLMKSNSLLSIKVFPLDEMSAVCGFEAFINDKHVIGEIKEKEQARKEYTEAVSQGHGTFTSLPITCASWLIMLLLSQEHI